LGNRGGGGGRNPAWGLTGDGGEVGEKLHGVERNPGVGSVGARDGRSGGSAKNSGRRLLIKFDRNVNMLTIAFAKSVGSLRMVPSS